MRAEFQDRENWHKRGYMPHYETSSRYQMITYRLADSLPKKVVEAMLEEEINTADKFAQSERRQRIEYYLDRGYGSCVLKDPTVAALIIDAWEFFNTERYDLIAYVVMPTHVHLVIKMYKGHELGALVKSWKSFTTKAIHKLYDDAEFLADWKSAFPGAFPTKIWQREYWDRFIRDERHFYKAIDYIHMNPVKAGLCREMSDWPYSSFKLLE